MNYAFSLTTTLHPKADFFWGSWWCLNWSRKTLRLWNPNTIAAFQRANHRVPFWDPTSKSSHLPFK